MNIMPLGASQRPVHSRKDITLGQLAAALAEALKQCESAYQFCPGTYTTDALAAVRNET